MLIYTISEITNTILTYDNTKTSTTLCTDVDNAIYNIPVTNFKYYNLTTNTYTTYSNICISTNGWLGFTNSIAEYGYGGSNQSPLNTLRYFSFNARSTITYYFDSSNNLFISSVGSSTAKTNPFAIIIKISPTGLIQVYYSSIGTSTKPLIIGFVGNNSSATTDDIFYSTFNGVNAFVQSNINGKLLNFDFSGLSFLINGAVSSPDIYTYTSAYGYTEADITAITGFEFPTPTITAPVISSINGTSPTNLNPTISITINPSSIDASTTRYAYSTDGNTYYDITNTSDSGYQLSSPLKISASSFTNGTNYSFTLRAYNGVYSTASNALSSTIYIPAIAPVITSVTASSQTAIINFTQIPSDSTITKYGYLVNGSTPIYINQTTSPLTITGLTNGTSYTFAIVANNGTDSQLSNSFTILIRPALQELLTSDATETIMLNAGYTLQQLKAAGFTGNKPTTTSELLNSLSFFHPAKITLAADIVSNTPFSLKTDSTVPITITTTANAIKLYIRS
jgi:hypothetical protein